MINKKNILLISFLAVVISLPFFMTTKASEDGNLTGYAWSDNVGWISFNYGTDIDHNGYITGYAWSDSLGWISFNSVDLAGCPSAPCMARYNIDNMKIEGWAKQINTSNGWIQLSFEGEDYGLSYDYANKDILGWSWSDNVGWISFNCRNHSGCATSNYGVKFVMSAKVSNLNSTINYCNHDSEIYPTVNDGLTVKLDWNYFSLSPQKGYTIQVSKDDQFVTNVLTQNFNGTSNSMWLNLAGSGWNEEKLDWASVYHWRVKVENEAGEESDWQASSFNLSRTHGSPKVLFSSVPSYFVASEEIEFSAQDKDENPSLTYNGSTPSYSWTFIGGNPSTSSNFSQVVVFDGAEEETNITLRVTDSAGYWCQKSKSSKIYLYKPPTWKEVSPF
ncbi:MAG: hypothetical protein PHF54_00895 [Candidatus Pacebacteria bacterium]|nr:hypothetical protein [Candidatus Paceibacterota bacterium]